MNNDLKMNNDTDFMFNIISYICDYAKENGLNPNETLWFVAKKILFLLDMADFSGWGE